MLAFTHCLICIHIESATEEVVYEVIAEPQEQTEPTPQEFLLSVETHRRVATGNTKSREVAGALAGTAPSSTARNSVTRP